MRRLLPAVGCLVALAGVLRGGQRLGSIEATFTDSEIVIRRGEGRELWRVDLSRLVRGIDCVERWPGGAGGEPRCPAPLTSPCPKCGRLRPDLVAWDEVRQSLYFGLATSLSREKPFQVFRYSLASRRVSRLVNIRAAAGIAAGAVSADGRYLAYRLIHHSPPAAGCASQGDIEIVDLWTYRSVKPTLTAWPARAPGGGGDDEVLQLDKIEWAPGGRLRYSLAYHDRNCGPIAGKEALQGEIDAGAAFTAGSGQTGRE